MKAYKNPIILCDENEYGRTADPYVIKYKDMYYHCYMKADGVYITEAKELCDIGCGKEYKVFADIPGVKYWFAPELHRIDGKWYIYGAPAVNEEEVHKMCVLELDGESPIGDYEYKGLFKGIETEWSIDGTVLEYDEKKWFVWTDCGKLYIAEMDSPYSITGEIVILAKNSELDFERRSGHIIEAPAVLKKEDKLYIVYSANNSKSDEYCLGMLTYLGGSVNDAASWKKSENAVLEKTEDIFGPGHCSFTTVTENGHEVDYIVYHANLESGSGWCGRNVFIQKVEWDSNNVPVFGKPQKEFA